MDRKTQIKQWLKDILDNNLPGINYKAFIFGSQANCKILKRSDIDLGIMADTQLSTACFIRIVNAIEDLPMLFKVDVVDFNSVDERFKSIALQNIEQL